MRGSMDASAAIDVWSKLEREPRDAALQGESKAEADGTSSESKSSAKESTQGYNSSIVFVGDSQCGKSTLIQTFLKPSAAKDTKPTIALEYSYARLDSFVTPVNFWEWCRFRLIIVLIT